MSRIYVCIQYKKIDINLYPTIFISNTGIMLLILETDDYVCVCQTFIDFIAFIPLLYNLYNSSLLLLF